jgi:glycosyltransferase involved in cell wall biosynthesis
VDGIRWRIVPASRRPQALSLLQDQPNLSWRNATPAYREALAGLLTERWDGVVVDHFASVHALPALVAWRQAAPGRRILYLSHEHERTTRREKYASYGRNPLKRIVMAIDSRKIGSWEDYVLREVDVVSLINPSERSLFEQSVPGKSYITTPPGYDGPRVVTRDIDAAVPRRIALLGGRGPMHKRNILLEWLDACARPFSDERIELDVIGDIPDALRQSLSRRYPQVRFSGFVDDLAAHLQNCRIGVVPDTVGRGVKVRLPSYIFARLPMLGLQGAIDGIPVTPGLDFLDAPDPAALAELCVRVIDDIPTLNRLQNAAYAVCDRWFDWETRGIGIRDALVVPAAPILTDATDGYRARVTHS